MVSVDKAVRSSCWVGLKERMELQASIVEEQEVWDVDTDELVQPVAAYGERTSKHKDDD